MLVHITLKDIQTHWKRTVSSAKLFSRHNQHGSQFPTTLNCIQATDNKKTTKIIITSNLQIQVNGLWMYYGLCNDWSFKYSIYSYIYTLTSINIGTNVPELPQQIKQRHILSNTSFKTVAVYPGLRIFPFSHGRPGKILNINEKDYCCEEEVFKKIFIYLYSDDLCNMYYYCNKNRFIFM